MLPIGTTTDYICRILNVDENSPKIDEFYENNYDQVSLIGEILSLESSIFLLRRSNQVCGSHIDNIIPIRSRLILDYENKYGEWLRDNEDQMW
jgi:hypothetical protein